MCFSRDLFGVQCYSRISYRMQNNTLMVYINTNQIFRRQPISINFHIIWNECERATTTTIVTITFIWNRMDSWNISNFFTILTICCLLFACIGRCIIYLSQNIHIVFSNFSHIFRIEFLHLYLICTPHTHKFKHILSYSNLDNKTPSNNIFFSFQPQSMAEI